MPTEAAIRAYESKIAGCHKRRAARRPAVIAFRNLFLLLALGGVIYTGAAAWEIGYNTTNPNAPLAWTAPAALITLAVYVALVAVILTVKHSEGHQIRNIAPRCTKVILGSSTGSNTRTSPTFWLSGPCSPF